MTPRPPDDRRRTAVHEAGHAVAAVVLGIPLEYVSIRPGEAFYGTAVPVHEEMPDANSARPGAPFPLQPETVRAWLERRAIFALAGPIAARWLAPEPTPARFAEDECERIALEALAALPPRLADLVVLHESKDDQELDEDNARDAAMLLTGSVAAPFLLEALRVSAGDLVQRFAAAIRRVADALERHAILTGAEVAAIVKGLDP